MKNRKAIGILAGALVVAQLGVAPVAAEDGEGQLFSEALTSQNPLLQRYFMKVPQLVHVTFDGRDEQFTVTRLKNGSLRQVSGLYGEPFLMLNPTAESLGQVYDIVKDGTVTFEEKLALVDIYPEFAEKPFQPPKTEEVKAPKARYLTSYEKLLMRLSSISKRMRWLFFKATTSKKKFWQLYYGAQIKILTPISGMISKKAAAKVAEEATGDIDRGQVAITPGGLIDQLAGVVAAHVIMKDEDMGAFAPVLKRLKQRIQGDALALKAGISAAPPSGGNEEDHQAAMQKRLEAVEKLLELAEAGP